MKMQPVLKVNQSTYQMKILARQIRPEDFPKSHDLGKSELPFEEDENPSKTEEQVPGVLGVKVRVELWVQCLQKLD